MAENNIRGEKAYVVVQRTFLTDKNISADESREGEARAPGVK